MFEIKTWKNITNIDVALAFVFGIGDIILISFSWELIFADLLKPLKTLV